MNIKDAFDIQSETALMLPNKQHHAIIWSEQAHTLKRTALEWSRLVEQVRTTDEQNFAVEAQRQLASLLKLVESQRVMIKAPLLEFSRNVDSSVKTFVSELASEELRISKLVGDFHVLEQAKVRAAQAQENERLTELERARERALAAAKSHPERDSIQEEFNERARAEAVPMPQPAKVDGQRVTTNWQITVTDIWLLARAHPGCVKIEPRLSEIKQLLDAGVKVSGVKAERETKASVITKPERVITV